MKAESMLATRRAFVLALALGLALARQRTTTAGYRFLVVYGLAFFLLLSLRAFGGGTFKDLKEITFVGPWIAMLSGLALTELSRRGRAGFLAAVVLTASLAAFGGCANGRFRARGDTWPVPRAGWKLPHRPRGPNRARYHIAAGTVRGHRGDD